MLIVLSVARYLTIFTFPCLLRREGNKELLAFFDDDGFDYLYSTHPYDTILLLWFGQANQPILTYANKLVIYFPGGDGDMYSFT